jgi:site-specific recombinase XerD
VHCPVSTATNSSYFWLGDSNRRCLRAFAFTAEFEFITSLRIRLTRRSVAGNFQDQMVRELRRKAGTNTKQRNLAVFFAWVADEYGTPNPYDDKALNRYAPGDTASPVLPYELIAALLEVTAGSDYEPRRDHAIIRLFLTAIRREQMTRVRVEDLDLSNRTVRIAGLKGHPDHYVAFGHKTAHALSRWLRVRASNPYAESATIGRLWLASRSRGALTANGIYQMLRRRAEQAGYDRSAIRPHLFRHIRAHQPLADDGAEGDLMRHMGWRDRTMIDRHARSLAARRAIEDAHRRGLDDRY